MAHCNSYALPNVSMCEELAKFSNEFPAVTTRDELLDAAASHLTCQRCFEKASLFIALRENSHFKPKEIRAQQDYFFGISECNKKGFFEAFFRKTSMEYSPFVPVIIHYSLTPLVLNMKNLIDQAKVIRVISTDSTEDAERKIDEQNECIAKLADCISEFLKAITKFSSTQIFSRKIPTTLRFFMSYFEHLAEHLVIEVNKTRKMFASQELPSLTNVKTKLYFENFKRISSPDAKKLQSIFVSLNILNLRRIEHFKIFISSSSDQLVVFEPMYQQAMTKLWKYADQGDFLSAYRESSIKTVLIGQLELGLGPLLPIPDCEIAPPIHLDANLLDERSRKICTSHIEIWTRSDERNTLQRNLTHLTSEMRDDVNTCFATAKEEWNKSVQDFAVVIGSTASSLDRTIKSQNLFEFIEKRTLISIAHARSAFEIACILNRTAGLSAFVCDTEICLTSSICGYDDDVDRFIDDLIEVEHNKRAKAVYDEQFLKSLDLEMKMDDPQKKKIKKKNMKKGKSNKPVNEVLPTSETPSETPVEAVKTVHVPEPKTPKWADHCVDNQSEEDWQLVQVKRKNSKLMGRNEHRFGDRSSRNSHNPKLSSRKHSSKADDPNPRATPSSSSTPGASAPSSESRSTRNSRRSRGGGGSSKSSSDSHPPAPSTRSGGHGGPQSTQPHKSDVGGVHSKPGCTEPLPHESGGGTTTEPGGTTPPPESELIEEPELNVAAPVFIPKLPTSTTTYRIDTIPVYLNIPDFDSTQLFSTPQMDEHLLTASIVASSAKHPFPNLSGPLGPEHATAVFMSFPYVYV